MKVLLQEDDCAPDAYEFFKEGFKEITGISVVEFKSKAFFVPLYSSNIWKHKGFQLESHAEAPYYTLRGE